MWSLVCASWCGLCRQGSPVAGIPPFQRIESRACCFESMQIYADVCIERSVAGPARQLGLMLRDHPAGLSTRSLAKGNGNFLGIFSVRGWVQHNAGICPCSSDIRAITILHGNVGITPHSCFFSALHPANQLPLPSAYQPNPAPQPSSPTQPSLPSCREVQPLCGRRGDSVPQPPRGAACPPRQHHWPAAWALDHMYATHQVLAVRRRGLSWQIWVALQGPIGAGPGSRRRGHTGTGSLTNSRTARLGCMRGILRAVPGCRSCSCSCAHLSNSNWAWRLPLVSFVKTCRAR